MKKHKTGIKPLDITLCLLLLVFGIYMVYRIRVSLHYKWNWGVIPQYLVFADPETGRWGPNLLLKGFITTIRLSIWGTLLATGIGIVMGICRVSDSLFKRISARLYVELVRNLPPIVLIFIFYYFISDQIVNASGIDALLSGVSETTENWISLLWGPLAQLPAFLSALITLAVFEGAYITEIIRSGIESIEKGQWEAAYALGMKRRQAMQYIVLPRAAQRILPILGGQFISTIKDSAIVSVISIQELTFQGMELMAATYLTFEVWITVTGLYLVLTLSCSFAMGRMENYFKRRWS